MQNVRPRPKLLDKQRPEVPLSKAEKGARPSDHNMNLGVPPKLRQGAAGAFTQLARKNAAMKGI